MILRTVFSLSGNVSMVCCDFLDNSLKQKPLYITCLAIGLLKQRLFIYPNFWNVNEDSWPAKVHFKTPVFRRESVNGCL